MEITDNILIHAQSGTPGVLCRQYFPERQRLDVVFATWDAALWPRLASRTPS